MKQLLIVIALLFSCISTSWGQDGFMVAGTVMDESGEPLIGVSVVNQADASQGTVTDLDGKFRLPKLASKTTLLFTYVGFKNEKYVVTGNKEQIKIVMKADVSDLDEVVVVGQANQRKVSVTGAITVVKPEILDQPGTSISNMLGGNVPGIIAVTRSGEPGDDFSEFWIRGISTFGANASALVLVDGVEGNINDLDPSDIESFSVLKDASATAVYGVRGANGVVVITTKGGKAGKLKINFKTNLIMSESGRMPEYADAYSYAQLANEARLSRGKDPIYSDVAMELIRTGIDQDLYPNVNWRDVILKDRVWQNQHFLSVSGGGTAARYYMSLSIQNKDAVFKQDRSANKYDTNVSYHKYSFLANMDVNLTKTTNLGLKLNQVIVDQNAPGFGENNDALWQAQANLTPLTTPVRYSDGSLATYGANADELSPYIQLNYTGFKEKRRLNTALLVSLKQDLSFITSGLSANGKFSYSSESHHDITRSKMPDLYFADGRNADGSLNLKRTREKKDLSFGKSVFNSRSYYWELTANYDRTFGDHRVGGLVLFYLQSNSDSSANDNLSAIPKRYESLSGRVTYGYKDTYFAEFNIGYTGSEQFPTGERFGWFPAVSGGWVPTQYEFIREGLPFINFLKFRASYGQVGNDRIGGKRFPYLTTIYSGMTGTSWASGGVLGEDQIGTDGLTWETANKFDVGLDAHLFHDKVQLTVDYFNDRRTGIFQQRATIPTEVGLVNFPWANMGSMRSHGFDGNISFDHAFNKDWRMTLRANFTYSRNKVTNWEESGIRYPYQSRIGIPNGVQRGLIALGLFKDEADIESSPKQTFESVVLPGDIKYKDVNNDGVINDDDQVPLSYSATPELQYGFAAEIRWKKFTLSALFEGAGRSNYFYGGTGFYPFAWESRGNLLNIVTEQSNRWTSREISGNASTENPNARFPRLTYGENKNNNRASTFWLADNHYLRFKNLTARYSYAHPWLSNVIGVSGIDISFIVNNICTWDDIKLWDPGQASGNGTKYPIQRTYTLQLNFNF